MRMPPRSMTGRPQRASARNLPKVYASLTKEAGDEDEEEEEVQEEEDSETTSSSDETDEEREPQNRSRPKPKKSKRGGSHSGRAVKGGFGGRGQQHVQV